MPVTVLVGNAINRFGSDDTSWSSVLDQLASACHVTLDEELRSAPLPLLFEYLVSRVTQRLRSESNLRRLVASVAESMDSQAAHGLLRTLSVTNILTTNYDYTIERALQSRPRRNPGPREFLFPPYIPPSPGSPEKRFSLFRRHTIGATSVWHIHGEALAPRSLILGHDQYVANLARLREYLLSSETSVASSPYMQDHSSGAAVDPPSWADFFLRDDLHIVGSALDFSEVGLWWLITLKNRLRTQRLATTHSVKVGTTTHYPLSFDVATASFSMRKAILEGLGVQVLDGFSVSGHDPLGEFQLVIRHIRDCARKAAAR